VEALCDQVCTLMTRNHIALALCVYQDKSEQRRGVLVKRSVLASIATYTMLPSVRPSVRPSTGTRCRRRRPPARRPAVALASLESPSPS